MGVRVAKTREENCSGLKVLRFWRKMTSGVGVYKLDKGALKKHELSCNIRR